MRYELAIVGGGLAGLSLALALVRGSPRFREGRVLVLESSPLAGSVLQSPSFDTRATALALSTVQHFDTLGLWAPLQSVAAPMTAVHVSEQARWGATRLRAQDHGVPALGHVVLNSGLGAALLAAVEREPGIDLQVATAVQRLQPTAQGMSIDVDGELRYQADLVVLADGGRSNLLDQLGIRRQRHAYGQTAIIANVAVSEAQAGWAYERFTADGAMALLPLVPHAGQARYGLVWTLPTAEAERRLGESDEALLAALGERFGARLGRFEAIGVRASYPIERVLATEQARHHLLVLGNAAHTLHPVAGQGFNLTLRDVMALALHLCAASSTQSLGDLDLLQRFVQARQRDQWRTILASDALLATFLAQSRLVRRVRQAGLVTLELLPALRLRVGELGMGLAG